MKITIGQVQMSVVDNKNENIKIASKFIDEAAMKGADIIVLPEMFNCPYQTSSFPLYAESEGGETYQFLSNKSKEHGIYIFGGTIPEKTLDGKIYNTCFIFDKKGNKIGKHRKTHLFDIDVKGGQSFKESDTLTAGNDITIVDTEFCKIGVMICYDIRFPEFSRMAIERGAKILIVPGAFNMTTGPAHWETLFRTRAIDNQVYTVGTAPARDINGTYVSYGNSLIVSPWGDIINRLGGEEKVSITEIELDEVEKIREQLPLLLHLRKDVYNS